LIQEQLSLPLQKRYDFIICGAGSSGSVVARRLAEDPHVSILLVEAGGSDDVPEVQDPLQWPANIGSERDWAFASVPEVQLNGRSLPLSMGKVLGGGSGINVMVWARGHKSDWDYYAEQTKDPSWSYASVLEIYKRIEDWHGTPDPAFRGSGGPVFVQPPTAPGPLGAATLEAAKSVGIPVFESQNGLMMEGDGGAARMVMLRLPVEFWPCRDDGVSRTIAETAADITKTLFIKSIVINQFAADSRASKVVQCR